ncbi:unnamed protein product [Rhizoctonia solani]|uniref:Protein kinase domain-containing protein n=1 Tax=Rhizoctonia solani TaxID=456999 RepID=A0A8H3HEX9_9AGAM|nr:unnamed protein product [Rhizoctonia solani]
MENPHHTRKASHDSGTAVIGNTTPLENVVSLLVQHGCQDLTGDIPTENAPIRPHAYGGACDVYKWKLNWDGPGGIVIVPVAIKNLRCSSDSDAEAKLPKRAAKELLTWLQLDHPNVLPLLGLAIFNDGLSMVSPWMPYGNLRAYLQRNKDSGVRMGFCEQIRTGLVYIHSKDVVHGDMKAMNVMVSHEGTAMITDFGNSILKDLVLSFAPTTTFGMTHQYAPPEHLAAEYMPIATKKSDVYSYGMEILTGEIPFMGKNVTWLVMQASLGKLLPTRPSSIGDDIWSILLPCWAHDPSKRPSISEIYFPRSLIHAESPGQLSNLGAYYTDRFGRLGELDDLKKAIEYHSRALGSTPDGHPDFTLQLFRWARTCYIRYQHTGDLSYLSDSFGSFRRACISPTGVPRDRFSYALEWARVASKHNAIDYLEAYQTAIDLLPHFIWLGATANQRYEDIKTANNLAVEAASAAIISSNYSLALEWLEYARCAVWKQSLALRSPMDELLHVHPALAARLQAIVNELHGASPKSRAFLALSSDPTIRDQVVQQRHHLAEEYNAFITQARNLPGFENFLRPLKTSSLVHAARNGPIVVVNCYMDRCDALIIQPGRDNINHIPLPNIAFEEIKLARHAIESGLKRMSLRSIKKIKDDQETSAMAIERVLGILWGAIVKPVLDFLGYTSSFSGNLPHITWCPTGALSFLPLHAAGGYNQPRSRVFDYVISSYTPTLTALLKSSPSSLNHGSRVLAIGQEATPGYSPLPGIIKELEYVKTHTCDKAEYVQLIDNEATTAAVLDAMEQHDWVHFAGHAHQDVEDLAKSGFYLHDGIIDLATINKRSFKNKGLAFLSACQTAAGDENLPDQAVHIASCMLMAGYPSVIATMWSVVDVDAPLIVDKVYNRLMKGGKVGNGEAGEALHHAVAALREKVGEKEFARWVPYIHIGL